MKVWEASYLPFGGVHVATGAPIDLRFPGQWFQAESSLHQNWMRDYDPTLGRYLQADPLGLVDGTSVFGYALQNPGRYVDPYGLYTLRCKNSGGPRGWGEVGYEHASRFYEGSRKRCQYTCTRLDNNVTKTFESCGDDMALGDQCFGVPWGHQSLPDGSQTTMKTGRFPPGTFMHETELSWWTRWTNSDLVDFNSDVIEVFGTE